MTAKEIKIEFDKMFPDAKCELVFSSPYELLVAVILSAQCTDKRVNIVTKELFKEFNTPAKMLLLTQESLEEKIHSCGFYHNKAKNILSMSQDLISKFEGQVPAVRESLESLAGVGRKTANVVLSLAFKDDAIAVDTHVLRVSNRLGLVNSEDPYKVEVALMDFFPKEDWTDLHFDMVMFGRYKCKAINPECFGCSFYNICTFEKKQIQASKGEKDKN